MPSPRKTERRLRLLPLAGLAVVALLLGGCESLRQAVGLEKSIPDESKVTETPPLSVPPDFALRPPTTGTPPSPAALTSSPITPVTTPGPVRNIAGSGVITTKSVSAGE